MKFVAAASNAAHPFVSPVGAKARRRHDKIVQLQKKYTGEFRLATIWKSKWVLMKSENTIQ